MILHSSDFSKTLILWYLENKRDLPWRKTKNPYLVWLSEIILQQTRVEQGLPYYLKFVENFPTVRDLANASEQEVLKLWQGLGYYSRARNLLATAKRVVAEMEGVFPDNYDALIGLKGIGDYTASAIASFCANEKTAVVDGNVFRMLSRIFGVETPINTSEGKRNFKQLAQKLIDSENPGKFNQAIMEFGAIQCVPRNPNCSECMFQSSCVAFNTGKVSDLPVKLKSASVRKRYFNYIILSSPINATLLNKRKTGIWQGLYEFPLIESKKTLSATEVKNHPKLLVLKEKYNFKSFQELSVKIDVHKLSHQHIYPKFWVANIDDERHGLLSKENVMKLPVPKLIQEAIATFYENEQKNQVESL